MSSQPSVRVRRTIEAVRPETDASPRMVAVFRRPDDTICHTRCGRALTLQGVRAMLEADFYCYACLTHVTLPLAVLDAIPLEPEPAPVGHSPRLVD
ncbi:MAG: hypothetical protein ACREJ9_08400 [Candidatus Rokuibacteriota bacterium]